MSIKKFLPDFCGKSPQHLTAKLESSNLVESELIGQLRELFQNGFDLGGSNIQFGLVGLHPCGDLAPLLLRLYSSREEVKFICIVGCCYMKMALKFVYFLKGLCSRSLSYCVVIIFLDRSEISGLKGYPLSKYLLLRKSHELSYTSLEVACHAIEKYCDKLKTGNYEDLIVK